MSIEITRVLIDKLSELIKTKDEKAIKEILKPYHPADIADIYESLDVEEAKYLNHLLEEDVAADVIVELEEEDREDLLKTIPSDEIAHRLIDNMESDDAADILAELPEHKQEEILKHITDIEQAGDIVDLLNYAEDSAGGLMAKELIRVNQNWTISRCFEEIRLQAAEGGEFYYVYVVDDNDIYKGKVPLKDLILTKPETIIKEIVEEDTLTVQADMPAGEVASLMEKYDEIAIPVVDQIGRLLGRITIDDVVDVIKEEADKNYQMISGISEDIEPTDNTWRMTRARIPWLFIGLMGGILVSLVLTHFEDQLKINPQMAFFMPLIGAMAGNVGIQSSSIIVKGLASNSLNIESTGKKLGKEFMVALLNGAILSSVIFIYNLFISDSFALTLTVSIALITVILFAALFGTLVPLLLERIHIDPAIATGPFVTTSNDIIGMFIYFTMGRFLYSMV